ncbi:MarR family winged helix-turn-helix transcriptional regulator [Paractinoplanes rhizophilus]|uniref:MarR family winged helix-turn-helix transcriptional regulator n=1 Tax=Paractinoplanes rhizophilus TaxID=1416877 RepID=A0ABW2HI68_9ACTN|nr:MarR family transcriptional regulator [Actinoplanes sp.]
MIRLTKQRRSEERTAVPGGALGMLRIIDRLGDGAHARELAAQAALDPSTVSRAVAALVADGLVARQPDPHDGRATTLAVTPAGRAALADALDWYQRLVDRALADWTPDEIAAFDRQLGRFTEAMQDALTTTSFTTTGNLEVAR